MSLPDYLRAEGPQRVFAALPDSRAVGGCVRDSLAGLPVRDLDMAAPFPPEEIARRLKAAGFKVFETGLAHGTVTAVLHGVPIEITSLRRDVATDGRHAEVEWTTDWREDAERRDFTINAMSMGADGALHDYFEGRSDLAAHRVRFVGDAAERLREDYLRALRFFRFHARYGGDFPDSAAVEAIRGSVPYLNALSAERRWSELKRLMETPDPRKALCLMIETNVLQTVLPEADLTLLPVLGRLVEIGAPTDPLLRLAAFAPLEERLFNGQKWHEAVAERFRLSRAEKKVADLFESQVLLYLAMKFDPPKSPRDRAAINKLLFYTSLFEGDTHHLAISTVWLGEARATLQMVSRPEPIDYAGIRDAIANASIPVFPLRGRDGLALGLPAGPQLGDLIGKVKSWWFDNGASADHAACLEKLRELVERDAS